MAQIGEEPRPSFERTRYMKRRLAGPAAPLCPPDFGRRLTGIAVVCATASLALPAAGSAGVEVIKASSVEPDQLTFRLHRVAPDDVVRASLAVRRRERRLELRIVRAAARRGALRVK